MRIKQTILDYQQRYPHADVQDHVKRFFQISFGPSHAHKPSDEMLRQYLDKELEFMVAYPQTPDVFHIGGGFYRVSLTNIKSGVLTKEKLIHMFKESMHIPIDHQAGIQSFKSHLDAFIELIEADELPFLLEKTLDTLSAYLEQGLTPVHHSKAYKTHHHPHYRLIHEAVLKKEGLI